MPHKGEMRQPFLILSSKMCYFIAKTSKINGFYEIRGRIGGLLIVFLHPRYVQLVLLLLSIIIFSSYKNYK
jgi:hypothetical protein